MTGLRSGQVAKAAGVNLQTLRYYERRGLLSAPDRTPGGHRVYPADTVTVLRVIKAAQRLGFSLEEVIDLMEAGRHRHHHDADAGLAQRAAAKLAEVEAKITDLSVIAATLRAVLEAGCADLIECAAIPHCPLPFAGLAARTSLASAGLSACWSASRVGCGALCTGLASLSSPADERERPRTARVRDSRQ